jgi:hypothetical protein
MEGYKKMIGKFIYDALIDASYATGSDPVGVYPIISPQEAQLPFIVYGITSVLPNDTKNTYSDFDTFSIEVSCCAKTYNAVNSMSKTVRDTLDRYGNYTISGTGYVVDNVQFTNLSDAWNEELKAYIQELSFDIIVKR